MRSPSFTDLRQTLEDYATGEGQEPHEVVMELMEHYIPGIEVEANQLESVLMLEFETEH